MLLQSLLKEGTAQALAAEALATMADLMPLPRSITGNGVRQTLDRLAQITDLKRHEVPSGTQVFDWQVPNEWNLHEAYIVDPNGERVVDVANSSLHVVGYSVPVRCTMPLEALQAHLHSMPEHPDWIPYRTSYYKESWGFCLRHSDRARLVPGDYTVVIDASLGPGHLSYAECVVPGSGDGEAIIYTHTCHPALANDNLSGMAIAALLARSLRAEKPRLTWRFIFAPGTIGSLTWLSRNQENVQNIRGGLVIGLLGDSGPLTYKRSRLGNSVIDRLAEQALTELGGARVLDFEPYGYDERQFCSPGFNLPIGRLTRSPNASYPEYHSSADDLSLVSEGQLAGAFRALARIVGRMDSNRVPINLKPFGEPQLGRRGLYGMTGGQSPGAFQHALLWVLNLADGKHDLAAMASRSGLPFETIEAAAAALEATDLMRSHR